METAQLETNHVQADPTGLSALVGTVKWFNPGKGYGFIAPETGGEDIFVHISAVQRAGLRKLNEGEKVKFSLQQREGRVAAIELERIG